MILAKEPTYDCALRTMHQNHQIYIFLYLLNIGDSDSSIAAICGIRSHTLQSCPYVLRNPSYINHPDRNIFILVLPIQNTANIDGHDLKGKPHLLAGGFELRQGWA